MVSRRTPISRAIGADALAHGGAHSHAVNVGQGERLLCVGGGGLLTLLGVKERGLLGCGLAALGGGLVYRGVSGYCAMYSALGARTADVHAPQASVAAGHGFKVMEAVVVHATSEDLYNIWRDFENLPRFMTHLVRVQARGNRSHWVAQGPAGTEVAWDAEIITEDPGRMIGWRSLEGSQIKTAGSVHFTPVPGAQGTEVVVTLKVDPPGGKLGAWLATLFGQNPAHQIRDDLRRFKALVESGQITRPEGRVRRF